MTDSRYEHKWYKSVFLMSMIISISLVIIFMILNELVLHYGTVYSIIVVLMIIPIGFLTAVMEFL